MRRTGFTMMELLTVIAVIAILAAITFPVAVRAKDNAYRNSDISNMNSLRVALQLYKADQGGFPPALFGYVTLYQYPPYAGQPVPANQTRGYLYPRRVDSVDTFRPAYDRFGPRDVTTTTFPAPTTAVWPNQEATPAGQDPQLDLNGDGKVDSSDDTTCSRQAFGTSEPVRVNPKSSSSAIAQFYRISGYDVAQVPNPSGGVRNEIHYALFWTGWGLGIAGCSGSGPAGNASDDPRQLGYADPPDNTVVTWNSFYRDYSGGVPIRGKRDLVLFLGGAARPFDSREVSDKSWRLIP